MVNTLARELYEKHRVGLFRYALSILKDPAEAEDVMQETFVRLITSGVRYEPGKEQAWLYKVARNLCFDILRKRKKENDTPHFPAPAQTEHWEFLEMIASLTPKEQEIVSLKIIGGFTHKEISKIMGLSLHSTKKRYERAITALRQEMEETK